jgi:hypothetical protein
LYVLLCRGLNKCLDSTLHDRLDGAPHTWANHNSHGLLHDKVDGDIHEPITIQECRRIFPLILNTRETLLFKFIENSI